LSYLGRRLVRAVLLLLGVSVLCFLFSEMAPGSFFDEMRLNPQISPETISALRSRYGLDQPLAVRYGRWVKAAVRADLGYSIAYNAPVAPLLWSRAKNTLLLASVGMILTWLVSVPLGVWAAARHKRMFDKFVRVGSSFIISIPEVVLAVGLLAIVVHWRLLPVGGMESVNREDVSGWGKVQDFAQHLLLPVFILTLVESAIIVRHVRASVLDVLEKPFVQAARGFGIGQSRLLFRGVLPAAASPAISLFGFSLGGLVSGSLLIEVMCGWPGLGPLILEATLSRDFYLVIGGIMLSSLFLVGGNLIADVLQLAVDPRIRTGALDAR
jgi:peptide/nickel transport system permease protein